MKQKYENIEDIPIEAIFEFTINPENTVCGFTAVVDGRVISFKKNINNFVRKLKEFVKKKKKQRILMMMR